MVNDAGVGCLYAAAEVVKPQEDRVTEDEEVYAGEDVVRVLQEHQVEVSAAAEQDGRVEAGEADAADHRLRFLVAAVRHDVFDGGLHVGQSAHGLVLVHWRARSVSRSAHGCVG